LVACLSASSSAYAADSGQRTYGQVSVEPAIDLANGDTVYLHTPIKAPFPSKANEVATAPLYLAVYPLTSTLPTSDFNCQPNNCDHVNVLPFPNADYVTLPGSDKSCTDFNGGNPCANVKGHDHLVGVAKTKGDFNVAWSVKLVVFTHKAFVDGNIHTRIKTLRDRKSVV
jgi:hypothetical protein